ncbi:prolipoprotein diacylglyceryl transferase [Acidobacteria bacterium AH-259-D05]|nr:prolipoprotein diacylglyceryl transferase [Acidobacteria bacterium AH-259-D05]
MLPRLFELGPLTIHTYGLLLATAYLTSILLASRLAEKEGVPRNRVWDLGLIVILSALLGAKLLLVFTDLGGYLARPSRLFSMQFWQAGGVYYGGFIGAVIGSAIFAWRSPDLKFWTIADGAAPAIALGQSIGRLGCFAAGCDYGKASDLPWAVTFTSEYAHQHIGVPINVSLHPTQLYESGTTFLLLWILLWIYKRRRFSGQVFFSYLMLYGIARFALEFFRGDLGRGFLFGGLLSTSQFISLLIVPAGIIGYLYFFRHPLQVTSRV